MDKMIEITGVDLRELVKAAYDLSQPQGLGFIHYIPGPLSDKEADEIIKSSERGEIAVCMDYVKGRAVKMAARQKDGKLYIDNSWFDHPPAQFVALLKRIMLS
jgi:hypothetical protein